MRRGVSLARERERGGVWARPTCHGCHTTLEWVGGGGGGSTGPPRRAPASMDGGPCDTHTRAARPPRGRLRKPVGRRGRERPSAHVEPRTATSPRLTLATLNFGSSRRVSRRLVVNRSRLRPLARAGRGGRVGSSTDPPRRAHECAVTVDGHEPANEAVDLERRGGSSCSGKLGCFARALHAVRRSPCPRSAPTDEPAR